MEFASTLRERGISLTFSYLFIYFFETLLSMYVEYDACLSIFKFKDCPDYASI